MRRFAIGNWTVPWLLVASAAQAQAPTSPPSGSAPQAIATESLVEPKIKRLDLGNSYPREEIDENGEGWVQLGMMVDTAGKPFEVTVVASSGDKIFERSAIRTAEAAMFTPGLLNGQPVESATEFKIVYILSDTQRGARPEFVSAFRELSKAIVAKDRPAAEAALKALKVRNLYEDAYLGLATYHFATQWGDAAQQLAGLERAIAHEQAARYLTKDQYRLALIQCLRLDVELRHYAEAQDAWKNLLGSGLDSQTSTTIRPVMRELDDIRSAEKPYTVQGTMPDGRWDLGLYERNFQIKVSEGHISQVKLRCAKGFVRFNFDPNLEYTVQTKYGSCHMQLDGDPGTQFTLSLL